MGSPRTGHTVFYHGTAQSAMAGPRFYGCNRAPEAGPWPKTLPDSARAKENCARPYNKTHKGCIIQSEISAPRRARDETGDTVIAQIMEKMLAFSRGNLHDIDHLIRVWTYAKTIGELEGLDRETLLILEAAAITHDIACPLCREIYGNTNGRHQEAEGAPMARDFLADTGLTGTQIDRVAFLVGHHHTFAGIDAADWQILVEADYIANAAENGYGPGNVEGFMEKIMKTESGKRLARDVFCLDRKAEECP